MENEYYTLWSNLQKLPAYQNSYELGTIIWDLVMKWDYFAKKSIGEQIVKSVDSIAANIAEGYGRYFYKDKIKFYYYARGSLLETNAWAAKAIDRGLIRRDQLEKIQLLTDKLSKDINILISNTRSQIK